MICESTCGPLASGAFGKSKIDMKLESREEWREVVSKLWNPAKAYS